MRWQCYYEMNYAFIDVKWKNKLFLPTYPGYICSKTMLNTCFLGMTHVVYGCLLFATIVVCIICYFCVKINTLVGCKKNVLLY